MLHRHINAEPDPAIEPTSRDSREDGEVTSAQRSTVGPFVVGTLVGGVAGAILGTALSPYTRGLIVGLYHLVSRRLTSSERDQLRFELLLQ